MLALGPFTPLVTGQRGARMPYVLFIQTPDGWRPQQ